MLVCGSSHASPLYDAWEDLDSTSIKLIKNDIGCASSQKAEILIACDALESFSKGNIPDIDKINNKRLIGVGVAINSKEEIPLELTAFEYSKVSYNESTMLGDKVTRIFVKPTNNSEIVIISEAVMSIISGNTPNTDNAAYKFALAHKKTPTRTMLVKGNKSKAVYSEGARILFRQHKHELIVIECHSDNKIVGKNLFYIQVFDLNLNA